MKILENVDVYRVHDPLFECVRIVMNHLGESWTPEYIQGISGAAFRIATGCPSRPTCCLMMWIPEFVKYLGYECKEYPCFDADEKSLMPAMIDAVRDEIDAGRPVMVWHAFTNAEWDVVCGYDEKESVFYGRGAYRGNDINDINEYAVEPWDRAAKAAEMGIPAFGAVIIGKKTGDLDAKKVEIAALRDAVAHAKTVKDAPEAAGWWSYEGIQALKKWAEAYSNPGKDRDLADAYCFECYYTTHRTAAGFLRQIAPNYPEAVSKLLSEAADHMEKEAEAFEKCAPYLSFASPWGVDEERSAKLAPLLQETADYYEKAIGCLEKALPLLEP